MTKTHSESEHSIKLNMKEGHADWTSLCLVSQSDFIEWKIASFLSRLQKWTIWINDLYHKNSNTQHFPNTASWFFLLGIYNIFYDNLHGNFSRHDSLSSKSHSSKHEKHSLGIYDTFLSDLCNNFIHLHMHARTRMYKLLSYPRAIPVRLRYTYLRIYKALSQLLFFPVVVPGLHQMTLGMFAVCSDDLVVFNRVADDNSWNVSYVFFENGSEL